MKHVGATGKEPPKKHAKEGPLPKSRRTRRLEEKQIKPMERSNKTKKSLKKRSLQHPWRKKQTEPRKPRTSRRKNSDSKQKSTKKPPPPAQNKSPRNPPNYSGKKKPPKKQQRKN